MESSSVKRKRGIFKIPLYIRAMVIITAVVLPFYWWITDTGIWRAMSVLQAKYIFDGEYLDGLNMALSFLATSLSTLLLLLLLSLFFPSKAS